MSAIAEYLTRPVKVDAKLLREIREIVNELDGLIREIDFKNILIDFDMITFHLLSDISELKWELTNYVTSDSKIGFDSLCIIDKKIFCLTKNIIELQEEKFMYEYNKLVYELEYLIFKLAVVGNRFFAAYYEEREKSSEINK